VPKLKLTVEGRKGHDDAALQRPSVRGPSNKGRYHDQ